MQGRKVSGEGVVYQYALLGLAAALVPVLEVGEDKGT